MEGALARFSLGSRELSHSVNYSGLLRVAAWVASRSRCRFPYQGTPGGALPCARRIRKRCTNHSAMNIAPVHIDALKALGYTEAEARFLYLVATHSGYFVARQFLAFANAHWGERTTSFWNKLHTKKHARTERFPKSGIVYHLFSRRLYRQIDRENIRNRRQHELEYIHRRIG